MKKMTRMTKTSLPEQAPIVIKIKYFYNILISAYFVSLFLERSFLTKRGAENVIGVIVINKIISCFPA